MPNHVLHDPAATPSMLRRVDPVDSVKAQDQPPRAVAPSQRQAAASTPTPAHTLQRFSLHGQQQLLLHLNRTQGNQQVQRLAQAMRQSAVIQRVPGIDEVEEIDDYMPICIDNGQASRKAYKRNAGAIRGESDTDLFYRDGEGPLVPITVTMVNAHFDPIYSGFAKISGPDWQKNCEDYAKEGGFGAKSGDYTSSEELVPLVRNQGTYVLKLSNHWMRIQNTNGSSVTIRQKDAESAVYERTYDTVQAAADYILTKLSSGGSVYAAG